MGAAAGCGYAGATWPARDPFIALAAVLGVAALGLIVAGLIVGTEGLFVALAADLVALWLVATLRHLVEGVPETPAHRPRQPA